MAPNLQRRQDNKLDKRRRKPKNELILNAAGKWKMIFLIAVMVLSLPWSTARLRLSW
jgi:hypothetical protein